MVYRPRHAPIQRLKAQILECFDPSLILAQQQMNDHDPSSYHLFTSAKDAGMFNMRYFKTTTEDIQPSSPTSHLDGDMIDLI